MTQNNLSFVTGRDLAQAGMQQALDHAEDVREGWAEEAMNALRMYLAAHQGKEFRTEQVREYAYDVLAISYPPHERAWGSITQRAAREGLIVFVRLGPVKTASSHRANASVWRAA